MVIDVHGHFGTLGPRSGTPADLAEFASVVGITTLAISNLAAAASDGGQDLDEPDANIATLDAAHAHPSLAALYWIRPGRLDSNLYAFIGAMNTEPFIGSILAPRLNGFPLDDPRLDGWMRASAKLGKPVILLCGRDDLSRPERALRLARRHPTAHFLLSSFNGEAIWRETIECAKSAAERKDAKLSITTAHRHIDEIKAGVAAIGAERILFGTDALSGGESHATATGAAIDAIRSALPAAQAEFVLGGNAAKMFSLVRPPVGVS